MSEPQHEDYALIHASLGVLNAHFEGEGAQETNWSDVAGEYLDVDSLSHIAMERAMVVAEVRSREDLIQRRAEVAGIASAYTEAFLAGMVFERTKTKQRRRSGNPSQKGQRHE